MRQSIFTLFCFCCIQLSAQNYVENAKAYFGKCLTKNCMNQLILKSFPTLDDAKKIFKKPEDAQQFMQLIDALNKKMKALPVTEDETFPEQEINTFNLKEINKGEAHYNLSLLRIMDKFNANVRFYSIRLLRENEFDPGYSYIYWMYINNKWVFISNPAQAFKN